MLFVGARVIPPLLARVARTGSRELFTLAVLALALGVAFAASAGFGVSLALGAFLAGVVVSESDLSHQAAADALPLRDAFAVLFFVSVGMLFDPAFLLAALEDRGPADGNRHRKRPRGAATCRVARVPAANRPNCGSRSGPGGRVLVHHGRAGPNAGPAATGGSHPHSCYGHHFDQSQPATLPSH